MFFSISEDLQDAVTKHRKALCEAAPDEDALLALLPAWYDLVDRVVFDIEAHLVTYRGPNVSMLLRWSNAWENARFKADDWGSYGVFVTDAPVFITTGE